MVKDPPNNQTQDVRCDCYDANRNAAFVSGLGKLAVDENVACFNQALQARAAPTLDVRRQDMFKGHFTLNNK